MKRRSILFHCVLALATMVLVGALATGAWAQTPKRGGTLVYVVPASGLPSMDGHRETTYAMIHPIAPYYSLLLRIDPTDPQGARIEGDLAESWTVSADKKTYTFKLHKNAKFHDGQPVTSKDVMATYNKIIFPGEGVLSPRKSYFLMVDRLSAPDPYTFVVHLKFGSSAFLPAMAMPYNFIYSADQLAKDVHWYEKNVNGSGPFKLKEFVPGAKSVGVRNENYFKPGLPYLDGFEAIFASKQAAQVAAIRGGQAMGLFRGFPPKIRDDMVRAMGDQARVQESAWNCSLLVVPNSHRKPFDDARVRRALNLAVDRWGGSKYLSQTAIVKTVGGYVFPHDDLAMSEAELKKLEGYWPDLKASRAKARQLLKEAGYPNGFKFRLHNRGVEQPYKIVGTWLIDQWRQIGLTAEQWVQPTAQFYKTLRSNPPGYDVSMDFNCQSIVNPTLDIGKFISYDKGPANNGKYTDRELDRLYEAQMRETDVNRQKALIRQFEQRILDQGWYFVTLWWHRIVVTNKKMMGWNVTPSHYLNMQMETVWLNQ